MRPDKRGVLELFERPQRYVIPLYQRRYVWSRQRQWEPLWADVQHRAEAVLSGERRVRPHFLGAVVWSYVRPTGREVPAYEVIDGQQRLTTFQILLAAFRDVTADIDPDIHRELERVTANDGMREHEFERFKVWPTRFDQPAFEQILDARDVTMVTASVEQARTAFQHVSALAAGYVYFAGAIRDWLMENDPVQRADALFQALRRHLQVVTIDLEEDDDPQVIFETLNARGEPLQPADLVRNFIFNDAARTNEHQQRLYDTYWVQFDEDKSFWRTPAARGRLVRDQLAWFLSAFLTVKLNEEVADSAIFHAFKRWWQARPEVNQPDSAELGLRELSRYAATYDQLNHAPATTRLGILTRRLEAMDISTLTPVLLYLLTESALDEAGLVPLWEDLESYTVRRFVSNLGTKNYNRFFLQLLQEFRRHGVNRSVLRTFLSRGAGESVRWPDDAEFHRNLVTSPVYRKLRARGVSMVLEAIDVQLLSGKQEKLHIAEALSVEHVLPRSWRKYWAAPQATPDIENPDAHRDALLHTLGNLTLVTGKLNSGLSNGPYKRKRVELARQSRLPLNRFFQDQQEWDEAVIEARSKSLAEHALIIWGAPDEAHIVQAATEAESLTNATTQLDQAQALLAQWFPKTFYFEEVVDGFQLLMRHWSRSLKYQLLVEEGDQGEYFRLGLYDLVPSSEPFKQDVGKALVKVAEQVALHFGEYQVEFTPSSIEILLPEDTSASRLVSAVMRFLLLTTAPVELALAPYIRSRRIGWALPGVVAAVQPLLPAGYFLHSRNMRDGSTYQQVGHGGWETYLRFEIRPKADEVIVAFHEELHPAHPAKARLKSIWPQLFQQAKEAFPARKVTIEEKSELSRILITVPVRTRAHTQDVAVTLVTLIHTLHPLVAPLMQPDEM
ncbi:DUF262 domain-containing protein [Deinococcus arcticus]|uniref:DUF262 domain-containing protein n=1 Tax=Deinococcus arcticus TaxID=2136176 RepID=A0A2T3W567_9DEIO|nr:DUF262 domain-containing protein [Deinococcus arcticus]PTA66934.1 hypothetical protein C8263_15310 [Deinococcus arcticus]